MIRILNNDVWNEFVLRLPKKTPLGSAAIPDDLPLQGVIDLAFWVPAEPFWADIRDWVSKTSQLSTYYFLLEGIKGEDSFFEIDLADLNEDEVEKLNVGYRSAIVGKNFDWVISSDDEKQFFVAGDARLYELLKLHEVSWE